MSAPVLVCFAVRQEAKPFQKFAASRADVQVLLTGMGARNAEQAIGSALETIRPARVFSCGFAGALAADLNIGDVVFETNDAAMAENLLHAGARAVRFHGADRVAVTALEKASLRTRTQADAVEMESNIICPACAQAGIPSATVRAISDTAPEDLPLDFNRLMTADSRLSGFKLMLALLQAPQRIPALLRLGNHSALAARQLAAVLARAI
jgi:nucleoside phosphorylase